MHPLPCACPRWRAQNVVYCPQLPAQLPSHCVPLPLQVLIESRQGPVRNILNAQELVDDCNRLSASWPLDPASPIKRIQCRWAGMAMGCAAVSMEGSGHARQSELHAQCILVRCEYEAESTVLLNATPSACPRRFISFGGDPMQDMLATASADVLVAVHGAGCTNWLFMAPGSALLEIRCVSAGPVDTGQRLVPAAATPLLVQAYAPSVSQRLPAFPTCCGSSAPAFLHPHCPQALPVWLSRLGGRLLPLHQRQQQPDPLLLRPEHRGGWGQPVQVVVWQVCCFLLVSWS